MAKLLMISGDRSLAQGKKGAFYNTLEEFHKYWTRIDIIIPRARGPASPYPHSAQLLFARYGGPPVESPLALFGNVFIHCSPWPLIFQSWWILKKGQEIYKEQKFDLITVHEYPPFYNGIGARILWNKIKVPYVLEIFHIPGYPKAANFKEKIYRQLFYYFIKYDCEKSKAVRVMNDQVAAKLIDLGVPKSKISLIPAIYIDLDIFKPTNLLKEYDLIFIGRLAKNKGIYLLFEAMSKLKIQNPNLRLLVVGTGPLEESLKFKVRNLKLENNIIFHGWAEDSQKIAKFLNQSKILVMPSYNEGGPRVVAEAMACGVPILATPVGIVADIIKDGQSGRIVDWDAKDITEKAHSLLNDNSEYEKYRQAGIEKSHQFEKKSAIKSYALKIQNLTL